MLMLNERIFWECAPHRIRQAFPVQSGLQPWIGKADMGCLMRSRMPATEHEKDTEAGATF
jgi:hypothetical protein